METAEYASLIIRTKALKSNQKCLPLRGASERRAGGNAQLKLLKHEKVWIFITVLCVTAAVSVVAAFRTPASAATIALAPLTESAAPLPSTEETVDINTAPAAELDKLPGIGEKLAAAIVSYREAHGGFQDIEDIMDVPGIGAGKFEKFRDRITVGGEAGTA